LVWSQPPAEVFVPKKKVVGSLFGENHFQH
jgi:hypothetical protein